MKLNYAGMTRNELMGELARRQIWDRDRPMRLRDDDELRKILEDDDKKLESAILSSSRTLARCLENPELVTRLRYRQRL